MHSSITLGVLLSFFLPAVWADQAQQPITNAGSVADDIIDSLEEAAIIPEVINTFEPAFTLRVNWTNGTSAELGNVLPPSHLKDPPEQIELTRIDSSTSMSDAPLNNTVIILTDPDALSRNKPVWSEMCHWIKYAHAKRSKTKSKDVMSYYPPGPPPKTGAHRYVMLALAPGNGTSKKLHLTQPSDRKHWGYSGERIGVRRWAKDNGLEVIAGNFFYAQNEEQ